MGSHNLSASCSQKVDVRPQRYELKGLGTTPNSKGFVLQVALWRMCCKQRGLAVHFESFESYGTLNSKCKALDPKP